MKLSDLVVRNIGSPFRTSLILSIPFVVVFVLLIAVLLVFNSRSHDLNMQLQLRESAKAYFEQILITRLWNAEHGGVYIEVSSSTQPNPYLDDPQRDIIAVGGKKYTKVNPAYMTRQIAQLADKEGTYKFHITSLRPVNPDNSPDPWERKALGLFDRGEVEGYEIADFEGQRYFRYMAPLFVKQQCLECHAKDGYKFGDVRGGISISIPTAGIERVHRSLQLQSFLGFGVVGVFSLTFVIAIVWSFSVRLRDGIKRELEAERLKIAIQLAGAAAHELRQPMSIISGFSEILNDKLSKGEPARKETEIIIDQCYRMNGIINRMLNITTYRTKNYGEHAEILDLDKEEDSSDMPPGR